MHDERMKILEMVENGKISADEAALLLQSLGRKQHKHGNERTGDEFSEFSQNVTDFAREFADKVTEAYKSVHPKVVEITKTVVSKTADVAENISKSLNESIKHMNESDCACGGDCGCEESKPEEAAAEEENREN